MHAPSALRPVWRPLALSTIAQLPLAALGIGLLIHVQHITGSYGAAGLVSGAFAASTGLGAPMLGRIVDRKGTRQTLIASAVVSSASLALVALAPGSFPIVALILLAAAAGGATPPIAACMRSLLPHIVDRAAVGTVFAIESSALELTFIAGPPLALAIGSAWSPRTALVACAIVLLVATAGFAIAAPLDSAGGPAESRTRSALTCPAIRTLAVALACIGALFGAVEVAVTALSSRMRRSALNLVSSLLCVRAC